MLFADVLGQEHIKKHLTQSVDHGRIPHAQLFTGPEGCGSLPMAIAYARYILCNNKEGENTGGNSACNLKFDHLSHPDLHFVFPVATNDKIKSHPVSSHFMEEWRSLINEQPYCNLYDWYTKLGIDNKQGQIGVDEAHDIVKSLSLKSYEGGYKIMIIWMAEKMNIACANKLLKLLEEPPEKTIFILIAEDEEQLISTVRSRCQVLNFPPLSEEIILNSLVSAYGLDKAVAATIAHRSNGNFNKATDLIYADSEDLQFEKWFVFWIRSAFKAKGSKSAIHDLISWSEEVAKTGRETQKQFLNFCLDMFRQALMLNYQVPELVYTQTQSEGFSLEKFAPFVHENNILDIAQELQEAIYHIERNANSKIVLTDLSIKLTRLLHKKAS
ncbi:MAG: DNA polymerase III subunit delta' [Bacteroidia bacterium]|nr:DNA polymerase III subunit delta' [Bacteroidia bacterium]MBT8268458.1 DNA polymerase III subunit delta' [Bacteroidia bacterium]NNF82097.1 DNA polymerase III subunit delta' [Flavobacteriaceae bacterium]NNK70439.1 DNA polymerase III subunit delta' [Flavobacteriaceae bacterium]NNL80354.1 DNA polymerase III subunit delta' [Flavobacteriaceae bacterium]